MSIYSVLFSGSHGDLACVTIYSACRFTVCKPPRPHLFLATPIFVDVHAKMRVVENFGQLSNQGAGKRPGL